LLSGINFTAEDKELNKPKRFVLAYDLHVPNHHEESWNAVLNFLAHNKVDGFIWGGDQLSLDEISHWNKTKPLYRERGAMARNIKLFDDIALSKVEKLLKPDAEKVWITGNHCRFEADLLEEMPELDGMVSLVDKLRLRERGWKVVPLGGHHKVGGSKLHAIHGDQISGGMHPAKKAVDTYCASVVMGHSHTHQSFTKASPLHHDQRWTAYVVPCLCDRAPGYGRGRPNAWVNGFCIVEVWDGWDFNVFPITVTGGKFSFGGRVYSGRKRGRKKMAEIQGVDLDNESIFEFPEPHEIRNKCRPRKQVEQSGKGKKRVGKTGAKAPLSASKPKTGALEHA
jgi:hypothetical protein